MRWLLLALSLVLLARHVPTRAVLLFERVLITVAMPPEHYPGVESREVTTLHPGFRVRLERALGRLRDQGYTVTVHRTWRDAERQRFYRQVGWSHVSYGYHNVHGAKGEPEALAADVAPVGLQSTAERAAFWRALLAAARAEGLTTGATWKNGGVWHRSHPDIGWDPGHVQVAGTSLRSVRQGWRPRP